MTIEPLFRLLGATDELLPLIGDYMGIWYFAEPAAAVMWTCLAAMRARGNSLLEGKIITMAAVINAVLDPIFIFGWLGFPRMEIAGAALATLVANLIMLVGTLGYLHIRLRVFATPFTAAKNILDSWRRMLQVGLPAMATNAIVPIANGIIVAMIAGVRRRGRGRFRYCNAHRTDVPDRVFCAIGRDESVHGPELCRRETGPGHTGA